MFVITAIVGNNFRNERSLHPPATISSPRLRRALLLKALRRPPITAVGSGRRVQHQRSSTWSSLAVGAGDGHRVTQLHQSASISPADDLNLPSSRFGNLRVVCPTADDRPTRRRAATCSACPHDTDAKVPRRSVTACVFVGAANPSEIDAELGNAAHADPANADEVHAPVFPA